MAMSEIYINLIINLFAGILIFLLGLFLASHSQVISQVSPSSLLGKRGTWARFCNMLRRILRFWADTEKPAPFSVCETLS